MEKKKKIFFICSQVKKAYSIRRQGFVYLSLSRDGFVQQTLGCILRHYKLEKSYARGETFSKLCSETREEGGDNSQLCNYLKIVSLYNEKIKFVHHHLTARRCRNSWGAVNDVTAAASPESASGNDICCLIAWDTPCRKVRLSSWMALFFHWVVPGSDLLAGLRMSG